MRPNTAEADGVQPGERCPMSGKEISFPNGDEWVEGAGVCFYCGGSTRLRVRGTDLFPRARCLTHKVPKERADTSTNVVPEG